MTAASPALLAALCLIALAVSSQPAQCFTFHASSSSTTSVSSRKSVAAAAAVGPISSSSHDEKHRSFAVSDSRPPPLSLSPYTASFLGRMHYRRSSLTSSSQTMMILRMTRNNNQNDDQSASSSSKNIKLFELENAFEDDGENVVGTKFFGGNTIKEELYVPEEEERALELQNVKDIEYKRFEDRNSFGDELAQRVGEAWQYAINQILYKDNTTKNDDDNKSVMAAWKEDDTLEWDSPFSLTTSSGSGRSTPLTDLATSKSFYNKLDVAILSANTVQTDSTISVLHVRWEIGLVWPNFWESRALLTGSSMITVSNDVGNNRIIVLKQMDKLDGGSPRDIVGALSGQLLPRFWDIYHIGMTPSAECSPRYDCPSSSAPLVSSQVSLLSKSSNIKKRKGIFSNYRLSHLPPRLVIEPSLIDTNGREARTAQVLPNHGFTTAIKTMGPNKEEFVPVCPIEISISKLEDSGKGSLIKWSIPVPPEFASNAVLPLPLIEDEEMDNEQIDEKNDALMNTSNDVPFKFSSSYASGRWNNPPPSPPQSLSVNYSLRSSRLVATLPYAGNPQDEEVTQLRRKLYQQVVEKDGYTPKLDPVTNRPIFFFWMNGAKACFTRGGGLGMAVYEWRGDWSKSNEVGIELEC